MNSKIIWTIGTILILVLLAAGAMFYLYVQNQMNTPPSSNNNPTGSNTIGSNPSTVTPNNNNSQQNTGEQGIIVAAQNGDGIVVKDFKKDPETVAYPDGSLFYLSGGLTPSPSKTPFSLFYVEANKTFHITLLQEPLAEVRQQAEKILLSKTGLTEAQACSLVVYVGVPVSVNEFFAGKELGLSFCAGSVAF